MSTLSDLYEQLDKLAATPASDGRNVAARALLAQITKAKTAELERWKREVRDPMMRHTDELRTALGQLKDPGEPPN